MHKHIYIGILILGTPLLILAISILVLVLTGAPRNEFTSVWVLATIMEGIFIVPSFILIWSGITNIPIFSHKFRSLPFSSKFASKSDSSKLKQKNAMAKSKEIDESSEEIDFTF